MVTIWQEKNEELEFEIYQVPCRDDLYAYLISSQKIAVCINPFDKKAVQECLETHHLTLQAILLTHENKESLEGAVYLRNKIDTTIIGPKQLDCVDQEMMEGDECSIGALAFQVVAGFKENQLGYYFSDCGALFCGKELCFTRSSFEGNEMHYFESIQKVKKLPSSIRIFLDALLDHQIGKGEKALFFTLEKEVEKNPFFQATSFEEFLKIKDA